MRDLIWLKKRWLRDLGRDESAQNCRRKNYRVASVLQQHQNRLDPRGRLEQPKSVSSSASLMHLNGFISQHPGNADW